MNCESVVPSVETGEQTIILGEPSFETILSGEFLVVNSGQCDSSCDCYDCDYNCEECDNCDCDMGR